MKTNIKSIYILEFIILIYTLLLKLAFINKYLSYLDIINSLFWIFLTIFILIRFHFPKDKNYLKGNSIRIIIISLFAYIIVIYSMGLFLGFSKFPYSHTFINILKNSIPILIIILSQEFIRYIIARNSEYNCKPLILYLILLVILNIIIEVNVLKFNNLEQIFNFICVIVLPIIAKQSLYSFLTLKISLIPSIILRIAFELYPFVVPFFPNLSNYLTGVLGITFPFLIFKIINNYLHYRDKENRYYSKISLKLFFVPIMILFLAIIILVSGIFSHKMIAIGSNSMQPSYKRGDAIVYHKYENDDSFEFKIGQILVFKRNNTIVTHRIVKIIKKGNKITFKTKGDANLNEDNFDISIKDVLGIVEYKIKYVGYPTIWINEVLKKEK